MPDMTRSAAETVSIGLHEGFALAQIVKIREDELEFKNTIKDLDGARQPLWHDDIKLKLITQLDS
jgi:hypothetical protein